MQARSEQPTDLRLCHDASMLDVRTAAAIWPAVAPAASADRTRAASSSSGRTIIVRQVEVLQRVADEVFVVGAAKDQFAGSRPGQPSGPHGRPRAPSAASARRSMSRAPTGCSSWRATSRSSHAGLLARLVALRRRRRRGLGAHRRGARAAHGLLSPVGAPGHRAGDRAPATWRRATSTRCCDLAEIGAAELAQFGPADRLLANLNTPDDYAPGTIAGCMILPVHARIGRRFSRSSSPTFGLAPADQPSIVIETPPSRAMGDLAVPVAFELARRLRKAPRAIAQELAAGARPDRRASRAWTPRRTAI